MADTLLWFETMAAIPSAIALMKNMVIAMSTIQSEIESATTQNNWILAGYILALVIAAAMTFLSWKAGNRVQDLVRRDADARIKEADSRAATALENASKADERAGVANAEAARANEGLAQSNEEIARLNVEAEKAKAERAEADKQIEIAKANAARAREGIANAEVEVSRLRVTVANAEQKRAEAERALLELQERIKPRRLTDAQRAELVNELQKGPKGRIAIQAGLNVPDATGLGDDIVDALEKAGWTVTTGFGAFTLRGLHIRFRSIENPPAWGAHLLKSFRAIGLEVAVAAGSGIAKDEVTLLIGDK